MSNRENLSKDLYLISQMDSDQFVPIWTIASMEGIKVLTTDMDLILDVLRCMYCFTFLYFYNFTIQNIFFHYRPLLFHVVANVLKPCVFEMVTAKEKESVSNFMCDLMCSIWPKVCRQPF